MRNWESAFLAAMQTAAPFRPLVLVTVRTGLASPNGLVRMCNAERPITFGGNVYTPRPFGVGRVSIEGDRAATVTLELGDDGAGFWRGLINAGATFEDRRIDVMIVERSQLDGALKRNIEAFVADGSPDEAGGRISIPMKTLDSFMDEAFPMRNVDHQAFPGIPQRK